MENGQRSVVEFVAHTPPTLLTNLLVRVLQVFCQLPFRLYHGLYLRLQLGLGSMQLLAAGPEQGYSSIDIRACTLHKTPRA